MFRENNPEEQVGQADGHYTLINPAVRRFTCTITTSVPDGDITTEGILIFVPNTTSVGAITGGTGAYWNARGEAKLILGPVVVIPGARQQRGFFADLASVGTAEPRSGCGCSCGQSEPLLPDLPDFLHSHRPHGTLTADATESAGLDRVVMASSHTRPNRAHRSQPDDPYGRVPRNQDDDHYDR